LDIAAVGRKKAVADDRLQGRIAGGTSLVTVVAIATGATGG